MTALRPDLAIIAKNVRPGSRILDVGCGNGYYLWRMLGADHPMEAHKIDSRSLQIRGQSGDVKEGIESFMQKRDPKFPNGVAGDFPANLFTDEPEASDLDSAGPLARQSRTPASDD